MILELIRVAVRPAGAFGVLLSEDGLPFAVTLERTFDDGKPSIPAGEYECVATVFYRHNYSTYEILVPGHSRLLFHKGNYEKDSEGCVLVAKAFEGDWISGSLNGFTEFMHRLAGVSSFRLRIKEVGDAPAAP